MALTCQCQEHAQACTKNIVVTCEKMQMTGSVLKLLPHKFVSVDRTNEPVTVRPEKMFKYIALFFSGKMFLVSVAFFSL